MLARLGLTVAGDPLWFDGLDDERQAAVVGLLVAEGRAAGQAPSSRAAPASGAAPTGAASSGPGPAPAGVDAEAWGRLSAFWEP